MALLERFHEDAVTANFDDADSYPFVDHLCSQHIDDHAPELSFAAGFSRVVVSPSWPSRCSQCTSASRISSSATSSVPPVRSLPSE